MKKIALMLVPMLALAAASARAEDPPASPFSANLTLTSKYKFRGQDQANTDAVTPAIQGGFDWTQNGFYLGNWNSSIGFTNAGIEMDFYGGYRGEISKDLTYDVGLLQYYYQQKDKVLDFNTTEIYGQLSYSIVSFKYSHTVSSDYFGLGEGLQLVGGLPSKPKGTNTGYFDLSANYEISKGLTLNGHVGYTNLASDLRHAMVGATQPLHDGSYTDYKLGATYDLGSGYSFAGAVVGANKKNVYGDINKARLIVSISKTM